MLADALQQHPDAAHVILTGDLTHNGTAEEYAHLRALLAACPLPVSLMLGNHDRHARRLRLIAPKRQVSAHGLAQTGDISRAKTGGLPWSSAASTLSCA